MFNFPLFFQYLLFFSSVMTIVALGGMFAERSGIINLALEGSMCIGACCGLLVLHSFQNNMNVIEPVTGVFIILLAALVSIIGGALYSLLLSFAAIKFKANQTIVGTALNILSTAICVVLTSSINLNNWEKKLSASLFYTKFSDYFYINMGQFRLNWFVIIIIALIVISWFLLYKTKFGLRLMACGENPSSADSAGINVAKMRYIGTTISGLLAGLGGFIYTTYTSAWDFNVGVNGYGFLALAVMIFGQWKPFLIAAAALLFGAFTSFSITYDGIPFLQNIPNGVFNLLPYVVCLISLIFTSKKSRAPKSEGIPYDKARR